MQCIVAAFCRPDTSCKFFDIKGAVGFYFAKLDVIILYFIACKFWGGVEDESSTSDWTNLKLWVLVFSSDHSGRLGLQWFVSSSPVQSCLGSLNWHKFRLNFRTDNKPRRNGTKNNWICSVCLTVKKKIIYIFKNSIVHTFYWKPSLITTLLLIC